MHHSVPSASVSMCQMRSARSLGAYSSIPSGCSSTWPSESTKSSGAVVVIETPRVRAELDGTLEEPPDDPLFELRVGRIRELRIETRRLHEDALLHGVGFGEHVQRERPIPLVYEPDRLVDVSYGNDLEDRAEDLLRHD